MVHAERAFIELRMHARGSWESMREAFEWHEVKPNASLAFRVLSQLPKCIHNSIGAQLNHGPFLLELCPLLVYSVFVRKNTRKLIKYKVLHNLSERLYWLNVITRFNRRTGVRLSRLSCTLIPYKKRAKNWQLCSDDRFVSRATSLCLQRRGSCCYLHSSRRTEPRKWWCSSHLVTQ